MLNHRPMVSNRFSALCTEISPISLNITLTSWAVNEEFYKDFAGFTLKHNEKFPKIFMCTLPQIGDSLSFFTSKRLVLCIL